jgi:phosphoribosyl-dephospho-CoA transferase
MDGGSTGYWQGQALPGVSDVESHGNRRDEVRQYQRACREIAELLDQGRLWEADRLNIEARTLFRRVYAHPEEAF